MNGAKIVTISEGIKFLHCNFSTSSLRIGGKHWDSDPEFFKGKISITQEEYIKEIMTHLFSKKIYLDF